MKILIASLWVMASLISCRGKEDKEAVKEVTNSDSVSTPLATTPKNLVKAGDYLITDTSVGPIRKTTTYDELQKLFGKTNILDTMDYGPEGIDSFIVTKIFSNTPKELIVSWHTGKFHKVIGAVDCEQENSPYQTADSLQVGSTMEKLLQVNGKKINFYGTGWDYGGLITSYNKGKFERSNIFFSLNSRDDAQNVMGDQELNTDMPRVKANLKKLYIVKISVVLHNEN